MRKSNSIISFFIVVFILVAGCASTQEQKSKESGSVSDMPSDNDSNAVRVDNNNLELEDYLRQLPGVRFSGQGNVLVRGVNSIQGDNRPLFVVDGVNVGRDYIGVRNIVEVENINYIRVLKGAEASIYGIQGGNGVIEITTQ